MWHTKPEISLYRNAIVTPFAQKNRVYSGAVYDEQGRLVVQSQRPSLRRLKFVQNDPVLLSLDSRPEYIHGRGYYIGHVMSHYGHLITEGISALWAHRTESFDFFLAHPFIWGREIPGYMRDLLEKLGIGLDRLRIVEETLCIEELVVPERLWKINHAVNFNFRTIIDAVNRTETRPRPFLKLYLSRSGIDRRALPNEGAIEEIFRGHGFVTFKPQNSTLKTQIELYGQTRVVAGLAGSALHNVIFCPAGAVAISLGDSRVDVTPNQLVCGALAGGKTAVIPFLEGKSGLDVIRLKTELSATLKNLALN